MFKKLSNQLILTQLEIPPGRVNIVLDTDTYNEIDDQFALVYSLCSPERLNVEAIYAAPFSNKRAATPAEGMKKSYEEILRLLDSMGIKSEGMVYKGSDRYLENVATPVRSEAAFDLIEKAMASKELLYVVAIGAITNIASAILLEPEIINKIVVVWLGGNSLYWSHTAEFNLMQDVPAAQVLFDCGVPLIQMPCMAVASHLTTTVHELDYYLNGKNVTSTYLCKIFREYQEHYQLLSKEIWDISAIATLINPEWAPAEIVHSPVLTERLTWSVDPRRHFIKTVRSLNRDAIFKDMFHKISCIKERDLCRK